MSGSVKIKVNGVLQWAEAGQLLSEIINGEKPCGGHGKCGKCRVIARGALSEPDAAEKKCLSPDELAKGVRLACVTRILGECEVETAAEQERNQIVTEGVLPEFTLQPTFSNYGVAIDVGTTTLAARLYDSKGKLLAETSHLNPQSKWGADVISRIEAALAGNGRFLAETIREALDGLIAVLAESAGVDGTEIDGAVITGNTVMLSLLTEENVEPFSRAPFHAKRLFGECIPAAQLGLTKLLPQTQVYLPPCISAFVGADTTCALIATDLCSQNAGMLVDIGTNGEMAVWNEGKLTVCSTAAGPAFEGVGISKGMRGAAGAIDRVENQDGQLCVHVIGNVTAKGICGTGLIDAVAAMLETENLDESGFLEEEPFSLTETVSLTQKDIRMLQLAKSAICAGMLTLLDHEELAQEDVSCLHIAGGFGNYLNGENAAKIGLLPGVLARNAKVVGNAALGGAVMLLLNQEIRTAAGEMAQKAAVLDLSVSPVFSDHYMMGMLFEER